MVTTTANSSSLLTPVIREKGKPMPWTPAQNRLFHVAAAGKSEAMSPATAKKIIGKEDYKVQAKIKGQKRALEGK
jgi:hypothetical protein